MNKSYHDYFLKNGKFIGAFEEMYQHVEDPWQQSEVDCLFHDISLLMLQRNNICYSYPGLVLDVGCGLGDFTAKIKQSLHKQNRLVAIDVSPTAIEKARKTICELNIEFKVCDITKRKIPGIPLSSVDLIVLSDILWFVLPFFKDICIYLQTLLKKNGFVLVNQTFYLPGQQKYGNENVASVKDLLSLLPFHLVEMAETDRLSNPHAILLLNNKRT